MAQGPALALYADYACPFCYLEQQSLRQYVESHEAHPRLDWHPYDIRSERRTADGSLDTSQSLEYPEHVHTKIAELAETHDDRTMLAPSEVPLVDSLPAQVVSWHVQQKHPDEWFSFSDRLFGALWRDGADISDVTVLARVATESGLSEDVARRALESTDAREDIFEQFEAARQAGVDDVPTLVYEDRTLREVVSPSELAEFVRTPV